MSEKNIRVKVLKEEVINEVTLTDLLDFASKAQIAVMQLTDNCMKFNDSMLRKLSARVNKDVADLSDTIRQAIIKNQEGTSPVQKTPLENPQGIGNDGRNMIENEELVTEGKKLYRKLKEAFGEEEDADSDEPVVGTEETPAAPMLSNSVEEATSQKSIDLSAPFATVLDSLSPEQFVSFKGEVVNALKASGITDPNFQTIVSEIENTAQVDDFNFALDSLYDYADANGIEISTEKPQSEEQPQTEEVA